MAWDVYYEIYKDMTIFSSVRQLQVTASEISKVTEGPHEESQNT